LPRAELINHDTETKYVIVSPGIMRRRNFMPVKEPQESIRNYSS